MLSFTCLNTISKHINFDKKVRKKITVCEFANQRNKKRSLMMSSYITSLKIYTIEKVKMMHTENSINSKA